MKAAFINKASLREKIHYADRPKPKCGPSQVLVKVTVAPVNYIDIYIRSGSFVVPDMPTPFILGRDMCGVVEEVGEKVTHFSSGTRVWSNNQGIAGRQGTLAEYIVVDEKLVYPLPNGCEEKEIAALLHSGLTAYLGLVREAKIHKDDVIFIRGGSGSVGSMILQMALLFGAKVIVTADGNEKINWCYSLGAHKVIDYKKEDVEKEVLNFSPGGVTICWDATYSPDLKQMITVLAPKGRMLITSGLYADPTFLVGPFYTKDSKLFGFTVTNATHEEYQQAAEALNIWFEKKLLKAKIYKVFPLSQTKDAYICLEQKERPWGKVLVTPT